MVLQSSLRREPGWTVTLVTSAEEALVRAAAEPYDAVILDGTLPGMDGFEACRRLKAEPATAGIAVVFLTGAAPEQAAAEARAVGAVGFLAKPFDPRTIAGEIRRVLGG